MNENIEAIKFYKASDPFGEFSNLYRRKIIYNNLTWDSTESAYQFHKFTDSKLSAWILQAPRQSILAMTAHLFNIPRYKEMYVRPDWDKIKVDLMRELLYCKFYQHKDLKICLISTGSSLLVEDTTDDYFWGCGSEGTGKNILGKLLMEVRADLQK